ncbi:hypothetical protein GDO86_005463 [Hymenochirus boettgeri]|uniref:Uncharacterized protein n=1 Tax=Hymenochirus boettgeri TaxID=247094 RepID=A0A8T2J9X7_9PIPI|nr:hypothetical protein GDO86_005463 [Hymenochirus boettgeri]
MFCFIDFQAKFLRACSLCNKETWFSGSQLGEKKGEKKIREGKSKLTSLNLESVSEPLFKIYILDCFVILYWVLSTFYHPFTKLYF